jgi:hypothetical protein
VLGDLRVLLLRHHRAAERGPVVELREPELLARVDDDLLAEAREVHERHRAGVQEVTDEVAVRDGVDRVREGRGEAELARRPDRVERQARARDRARSERRDVRCLEGVPQAVVVAREGPRVCGEVVAEQHGLGSLQVRVGGQHDRRGRTRGLDERTLQLADQSDEAPAGVLRPEPGRDRDLVVPRAPGVHAPSERAELLDQPALEVAVDVLVGRVGRRRLEPGERGRERVRVGLLDQALPPEHADVDDRGTDVVGEQRPVDRQRAGEVEQERIETARQAARPERAARGQGLRLRLHYTGCFVA